MYRKGRESVTLLLKSGVLFFFFFTLVTGPRRSLSLKLSQVCMKAANGLREGLGFRVDGLGFRV